MDKHKQHNKIEDNNKIPKTEEDVIMAIAEKSPAIIIAMRLYFSNYY